MARLASALKLLKPTLIPDLNIFKSVEEMLDSHRERNRHSYPVVGAASRQENLED